MAHRSNGAEDHNTNPGKNDSAIPDMISTLTHHLTDLGKRMDGGDRTGLGIVTLAGSNKGAVMKAEESSMERFGDEKLGAYTNSNCQAVNNSILMDGKCKAEDPGVHIEIVDCFEGHEGADDETGENKENKGKNSEGEEEGSGSK